ncbi:chitotriosidase-1-like [Patiria miniata]|uniref:Chitinase n=1 Tax=Patiria miniata TaxID=46514 RepID=A0A913ZFR5_PATMI|nr:chitotriosidase-1-like [Patiria miniata]
MAQSMWLIFFSVLPALYVVDTMPHGSSVGQEHNNYRVVCYFTNWAQYRPGAARFVADNMDPSHCTHMIFSFAKLSDSNTNRLEPYEWNDESTDNLVGNYEAMNNLKQYNPRLKTLLAVGGWLHGTQKFTYMAETVARRQVFIQDAIQYVRERNFDGLDLDWEFPGAENRGSPAVDKQRFTLLVQELRAAFEEEASITGRERLLLTSACSSVPFVIANGYEIAAISSALDFINLMAYDLHGSWEGTTGHHTSLYPGMSDVGDNRLLTVSNAVDIWLKGGTPPSKLGLGMGLYGRSFNLTGQATGIGAPASGAGTPGGSTQEAGFLSYYEICEKLQDGRLTRVWDPERQVPYAFQDSQWVGYDDPQSIQIKVDFLLGQSLGGAMLWAVDLDDFNGNCGETWPLMKAINRGLTLVTDEESPAETRQASTPFTCLGISDGYYVDPSSCRMYYICNNGVASHLPCGQGLYFDPQSGTCNYPENVQCNVPDTPLFCDDRADGFYMDPADCSKFFQCASGLTYPNSCLSGLLWNTDSNFCDWPGNVNCNQSVVFSCQDRGHGYYGDPYDCAGFYHCAVGKAYRYSCGHLYWNALIGGCDNPANVQCILA